MFEKKDKIRDLIQGLGSLWLVIMAVLFLGDRAIFYQVLSLSLIALGLLFALLMIMRKRRFGYIFKRSADQNFLIKLRKMRPEKFEDFIADLYRRLGYSTHRVGGLRDNGIDVTAEKNGAIYYIQCKKYITSEVTLRDVHDFHGAMASSLVQGKGIFITTNIFTTKAIGFAVDKPIELIDGSGVLKLIKQAGQDKEEIEDKIIS